MLGAVARDLHVAGHGEHLRRALGHDVQPSVVPELADRAAEEHLLRLLRLGHQPRAADVLPVVRQLDCCPVHDALAEDAQLIADGVARGGDVERGHGIQIEQAARRPRPPLPRPASGSTSKNIRRAEAQLADRLAQHAAHAEVVGVLFQAAAQQEFHGKVMHLPLFPRGAWPFGSPHRARSSRRAAPAPRRASPARRRPPRASTPKPRRSLSVSACFIPCVVVISIFLCTYLICRWNRKFSRYFFALRAQLKSSAMPRLAQSLVGLRLLMVKVHRLADGRSTYRPRYNL